jgi:hypothetical protein
MSESERTGDTVRSKGDCFYCSVCGWEGPVKTYTHACVPYLKGRIAALEEAMQEFCNNCAFKSTSYTFKKFTKLLANRTEIEGIEHE